MFIFWSDNHMHVIVHDHKGDQLVALIVKVKNGVSDDGALFGC